MHFPIYRIWLSSLLCQSLLITARQSIPSASISFPSSSSDESSIANSSNPAPPTFERLVQVGWMNMRRERPHAELSLIVAKPINGAPTGTRWPNFRKITILAWDAASKTWCCIRNVDDGRNIWNGVEEAVEVQGSSRFAWAQYSITLQAAFQRVAAAGFRGPWRDVVLSKDTWRQHGVGNLAYVFLNGGHALLVDAENGDVTEVVPSLADGISDVSLDGLNPYVGGLDQDGEVS